MYIVGSLYIKREPIIVLIEQDSGHEMGFFNEKGRGG